MNDRRDNSVILNAINEVKETAKLLESRFYDSFDNMRENMSAEFAKTNNRISNLEIGVNDLTTRVNFFEKSINVLHAKVNDHDNVLFKGNGKPPIVESIKVNAKSIENLKKINREKKKTLNDIIMIIIKIILSFSVTGALVWTCSLLAEITPLLNQTLGR